ncbi:hypothetical protein [Streptomyces anulatus]|uniref:hypothetical protein n=1 Tax=Streptomyces anulatus TaxID=1892 RepID=UPI00342CCF8A
MRRTRPAHPGGSLTDNNHGVLATVLPGQVRTPTRGATVAAACIRYLRDGSRRMHILKVPHGGSIDVSIALDY